jgi:hypothetical protein
MNINTIHEFDNFLRNHRIQDLTITFTKPVNALLQNVYTKWSMDYAHLVLHDKKHVHDVDTDSECNGACVGLPVLYRDPKSNSYIG